MGKDDGLAAALLVIFLGGLGLTILDSLSKTKCPYCKNSINKGVKICPKCRRSITNGKN